MQPRPGQGTFGQLNQATSAPSPFITAQSFLLNHNHSAKMLFVETLL